jgi:NAD-dependent DNA ligase
MKDLLKKMEYNYYNSDNPNEIVPDELYDRLKEMCDDELRIGAPPSKAHPKKKLAFFMGSLDKIKPTDEQKLTKWASKDVSFIIQPKLDGVSGLFMNGFLFTRGDGTFGADISHIVPFLNLPKVDSNVAIRGEILMSHEIFHQKYASKFKNSRNLVSGLLNSKTPDSNILKDLIFMPYEILSPRIWTPHEQLSKLAKWGFEKIDTGKESKLSINLLVKYWEKWNQKYTLPSDGIVICKNVVAPLNTDGNPDYAIAFKQNKEIIQALVKSVFWNASKYNVLKPRIEIEPVTLNGATITFLTGFNAKYIQDNQIGPNTILEITRSGDVIPHILRVVKSTHASMPIQKFFWNGTNVDIILDEKLDKQAIVKQIHFFLKSLEIKNVAEKSIEKIVAKGFDSIPKFLTVSLADLQSFGPVESENIYNAIHDSSKLLGIPLPIIMTASGIFGHGVGTRKIQKLVDTCPEIMETTPEKAITKISSIDGWTIQGSTKFMELLPQFKQFLIDCPMISYSIPQQKATEKDCIVFSGFRDKELEIKVGDRFKLCDSVTAKTTLVIVKDLTAQTTKTKKAQELGIPIQTLENFKKSLQ